MIGEHSFHVIFFGIAASTIKISGKKELCKSSQYNKVF